MNPYELVDTNKAVTWRPEDGRRGGEDQENMARILTEDIKMMRLEIAKPRQAANNHAGWGRLITQCSSRDGRI